MSNSSTLTDLCMMEITELFLAHAVVLVVQTGRPLLLVRYTLSPPPAPPPTPAGQLLVQLGDWLDTCCLELARGALAHDYSVTRAQGAWGAGGQSGRAGEGEGAAAGSLREGIGAEGEGRHEGLPVPAAVMSGTDAAQAQASASFVQQLRMYRANVKVRLCVGRGLHLREVARKLGRKCGKGNIGEKAGTAA